MSRRMSTSALVQMFREAVCPQTLALDEDGAEEGASDGLTLSDALLVGWDRFAAASADSQDSTFVITTTLGCTCRLKRETTVNTIDLHF